MDEAEKYQQRLQAIAEKRRLQEEQERARREMEDEKLRLQQLKRKSLRDQWLSEAPLQSPTSPDAQSPRSPLWGLQAQEMEKDIDKLQSESELLTVEEEEKLKEQMDDGQVEEADVVCAAAEVDLDAVVQNGENKSTGSEPVEDEVNLSPHLDEAVVVLTNGGGNVEAESNHDATEESAQPTTNGPVEAPEGSVTMTFLGFTEVEADPVTGEEEGTLVIRAERVIITDEVEDVPEDPSPQDDQQAVAQSGSSPLLNPEEGEGIVEEVAASQEAEALTEPEKSETVSPPAEAQTTTGDGDAEGDLNLDQTGNGETQAEDEQEKPDAQNSEQLQPLPDALEGTAVVSVPVYSEAQPSSLTPGAETEGKHRAEPEGTEAEALMPQEPSTVLGQFQEVSLAEPREAQRTETGPGEQEPLLSQAKAPQTHAEPAAACSPASIETHNPARANQGGDPAVPKHKTCQCCSVM
ncbi:paralemmin-3 isoform X2 [Genypterus blacodes]